MRILQVNNTMNMGGIETFLMNVYKNIDRDKYEFIFLTYNSEKYYFENDIIELGGTILRISNPNNVSIIKHIRELYDVIKKTKVDVVHCHTHFNCAYVLLAAKLAKIPVRISHSHSTYALLERNILKRIKWLISRLMINHLSTERVACSREAGVALYKNKDFIILPNGIDTLKYRYNENIRKELRKKMRIKENELVVGHVGRIDKVKNHNFLIDVFSDLLKLNEDSKLILVGDGDRNLVDELKKKVIQLNIKDKVIFLGNRNDIYDILNILDIFVFPSIYEGFPVTLIETQANGLPAIISSNISKEVVLSKSIHFLSLEMSAKDWAQKIYRLNKDRIDTTNDLLESDYNIKKTIKKLVKIYNKSEQNEK